MVDEVVNCRGCGRSSKFWVGRKSGEDGFCNSHCRSVWRQQKKAKPLQTNNSKKKKKKKFVSIEIERMRSQRGVLVKKYGYNFYTSPEWLTLRYQALKESKGYCELCGRGKRDGARLHVDHIKPKSKYPHLKLDPKNLQILCAECNLGKGAADETDYRGMW